MKPTYYSVLFLQKIAFVVSLIFVSILPNYAQTAAIDSLENWIEKYPKKDTVWVKNVIKLEDFFYIHQPQKIGKYAKEIIETSLKLNFFRGIAQGHKALILQHIQNGKNNEAIKIVFEKLKYDQQYKQNLAIADSYSLLGYIYDLTKNNKTKAIEYYTLAKKYVEKLPLSNPRRNTLLVGYLSNLSMAYNSAEKLDKGLEVLLEAYKISADIKQRDNEYYFLITALLVNISDTYNGLKKYDVSNKYIQKGFAIIKRQNIKIGLARFYIISCSNYIGLKQVDKANEMLVQLKKMKTNNELNAEEITLYIDLVSRVREEKKDFEGAYFSLKNAITIKDSLKNIEQQNKIQELSIKYETEQKEAKIKQLEKDKELTETRNKVTTISIAALLILLMGSAVAYWQVRKAKMRADETNLIKNKLFSIIAHDLRSPANNLKTITSTAKFVAKHKDPQQMGVLFTSVEKSALALSNLVENLLHWSLLQQETLVIEPTKVIILHEIENLMEEYNEKINQKKIEFTHDLTEHITVLADRITTQIILRNLIDNALKFTPTAGKIKIWVENEGNYYHLHITDTGIGIPISKQKNLFIPSTTNKKQRGVNGEQGTGIGLYLCRELAQLNQGNLQLVESIEHTKTHFVLTLAGTA